MYRYVVSGFKMYWDDPLSVRRLISEMEGQEGWAIFGKYQDKITPDQWAFYYGVIIVECMKTNEFAGYNKKEVHQQLFEELRSYPKRISFVKDGKKIEKTKWFQEDFDSYGKTDMAKYITDLIPHLALEHNIHIKDPNLYKIDQFITLDNGKKKTSKT